MAQHRNKACKAIESGIAGYPGGKNCLSARAAIRGKRATKNIRKCISSANTIRSEAKRILNRTRLMRERIEREFDELSNEIQGLRNG